MKEQQKKLETFVYYEHGYYNNYSTIGNYDGTIESLEKWFGEDNIPEDLTIYKLVRVATVSKEYKLNKI